MACDNWQETLVAALYDELAESEARDLAEHLGRCRACSERLNELRSSRDVLAGADPGEVTVPRLVVLQRTAGHWWSGFAYGSAAAAALLAVGALIGVWIGGPQPEPRAIALEPGDIPTDSRPAVAEAPVWNERVHALEAAIADQRDLLQQLNRRLPSGRVITDQEFTRALSTMSHEVDRGRDADVDYLLGQMAVLESRQAARIGQNQETLRWVLTEGAGLSAE